MRNPQATCTPDLCLHLRGAERVLTRWFRLIQERRFPLHRMRRVVPQAALPKREMKAVDSLLHDIIIKASKLAKSLITRRLCECRLVEKGVQRGWLERCFTPIVSTVISSQ